MDAPTTQPGYLVYHSATDHDGPSPHLRISWPRSASKRARLVTRGFLDAALAAFGRVENILLLSSTAMAYATFSDAQAAEKAVVELGGKGHPELRGLVLTLEPCGASRLRGDPPASMIEAGAADAAALHAAHRPPRSVDSEVLPGLRGLTLVLDFITPAEEVSLLAELGGGGVSWDETLKRRVAHFGWGFDYVNRTLAPAADPGVGSAQGEPRSALQSTPLLEALASRVASLGLCGDAGEHALNHAEIAVPVAGGEVGLREHIRALRASSAVSPVGEPCSCTMSRGAYSPDSATFPAPDQVTVNEYLPGKGISSHVDSHAAFQDGVCSLSLGSDVVMDLAMAADVASAPLAEAGVAEGAGSTRLARSCSVVLRRRSLLILRGEARFAWSHAIPARKMDVVDGALSPRATRVSVTIRCARRVAHTSEIEPSTGSHSSEAVACGCRWPSACFQQSSKPPVLFSQSLRRLAAEGADEPVLVATEGGRSYACGADAKTEHGKPPLENSADVNASVTPDVESRHVHQLYDTIAAHFSHTRHSRWPRVDAFIEALPAGAVVLGAQSNTRLVSWGEGHCRCVLVTRPSTLTS